MDFWESVCNEGIKNVYLQTHTSGTAEPSSHSNPFSFLLFFLSPIQKCFLNLAPSLFIKSCKKAQPERRNECLVDSPFKGFQRVVHPPNITDLYNNTNLVIT